MIYVLTNKNKMESPWSHGRANSVTYNISYKVVGRISLWRFKQITPGPNHESGSLP